MDYPLIAAEILLRIGGAENIASAAHCATRLRLVLLDDQLIR
jgi:phosphotransferase system IIB component